jgi:hypothetical protein
MTVILASSAAGLYVWLGISGTFYSFRAGCGQARQYACGGARAEKRTEDGGKKREYG